MATVVIASRGMRERYNEFVERHEVAWELVMAALAVAFVVIGLWSDDAHPTLQAWLDPVEILLTVIFVAEFGSRIAASYDRRAYLRDHWIDLVALIPTWTRSLRVLRLLRLLRLVRAFAGIYRALMSFQQLAYHRGLVWLVCAWLGVAVISSTMLYLAEYGVNPRINEPFDALWWGVVTLATVGYGDVVPVTFEGRLAAGLLMLLGITLFAGITGTITSYFITADSERRTGAQSAAHADSEGGAQADPAVRLRRLNGLLAEGLITQAEYADKRADIIDRL